MEQPSPLKPGPTKRKYASYHFLSLFWIVRLIEEKKGNEPACENEMENFGQNKKATNRSDPKYSGRKNQNRSFHLISCQNFRNLWQSGKHPSIPGCKWARWTKSWVVIGYLSKEKRIALPQNAESSRHLTRVCWQLFCTYELNNIGQLTSPRKCEYLRKGRFSVQL